MFNRKLNADMLISLKEHLNLQFSISQATATLCNLASFLLNENFLEAKFGAIAAAAAIRDGRTAMKKSIRDNSAQVSCKSRRGEKLLSSREGEAGKFFFVRANLIERNFSQTSSSFNAF